MTCADFMSLQLGRTDTHMHFLIYIIDGYNVQIKYLLDSCLDFLSECANLINFYDIANLLQFILVNFNNFNV